MTPVWNRDICPPYALVGNCRVVTKSLQSEWESIIDEGVSIWPVNVPNLAHTLNYPTRALASWRSHQARMGYVKRRENPGKLDLSVGLALILGQLGPIANKHLECFPGCYRASPDL